ncbi:MAG: hypothetical protein IH571_02875, partial [Acholeplasmataceae bacterium]|nr:hypothetical protein [Acholeplasmataceae bacterium]
MAKKPKEIASLLLSSIGLKTGYYNGAQFDQEDLYCFVEKDAFEGLLEDLFKDTDEEKKIKQAFMMSYIHDFGFNFFRQSKDKLQDISFIANNIARSEVITEGYLLDLVLNTWLLFFDQNAKIVTFDVKTRQSLNEEAEKHNITILEFTREIRLYRKVLGTDLSSMSLKELLAYAKELKDVEIKVKALYQKINKSQIQIPEAFSNHFSVISERYDSVYYEASQKLTQEIDEKKKVLHLQIKETRAKERKIKFKKIFKRFTLRLAFISLFLSALIVFLNLIVEGNFSGLPEFLANLMSSIQMNFSKFSAWISPVQIYVYFAFMLGLLLLMVLFLKGPYRKLLMFLLWVFALLDGIIYQTGLW